MFEAIKPGRGWTVRACLATIVAGGIAVMAAGAGPHDHASPAEVSYELPHFSATLVPLELGEDFVLQPEAPSRTTLNIVISPGGGLAGNAPALAAFNRAAAQWEAVFTDSITVTISANLQNLGNPNVIGSTSGVGLEVPYDVMRTALIASAEVDDGILASLPTPANRSFSLPPGFSLSPNVAVLKANLKAIGGFGDLDGQFGATDATIIFNSQFAFDYDNSNGVGAGLVDFETVALHEIGHALGFVSMVDGVDFAVQNGNTMAAPPYPLDYLRFLNGSANDPVTPADFAVKTRELRPNVNAIVDFISAVGLEGVENAMSTGAYTGDGRQASHWKDDALSGVWLGVMDPNIGAGQVFYLTDADLRALDLVGYDVILFDCSGVNHCSGHGTCVGLNTCACDTGWTGPSCQQFSCSGVNNCSGHGTCIGPNTCACQPGWTGPSCSTVDGPDCNGNGIIDAVDIFNGTSDDCNNNGVPDECEPDADNDGIPNACDPCAGGAASGDANASGTVTLADFTPLGPCLDGPNAGLGLGCECFDFDGDGDVDLRDFRRFQRLFN